MTKQDRLAIPILVFGCVNLTVTPVRQLKVSPHLVRQFPRTPTFARIKSSVLFQRTDVVSCTLEVIGCLLFRH